MIALLEESATFMEQAIRPFHIFLTLAGVGSVGLTVAGYIAAVLVQIRYELRRLNHAVGGSVGHQEFTLWAKDLQLGNPDLRVPDPPQKRVLSPVAME